MGCKKLEIIEIDQENPISITCHCSEKDQDFYCPLFDTTIDNFWHDIVKNTCNIGLIYPQENKENFPEPYLTVFYNSNRDRIGIALHPNPIISFDVNL